LPYSIDPYCDDLGVPSHLLNLPRYFPEFVVGGFYAFLRFTHTNQQPDGNLIKECCCWPIYGLFIQLVSTLPGVPCIYPVPWTTSVWLLFQTAPRLPSGLAV